MAQRRRRSSRWLGKRYGYLTVFGTHGDTKIGSAKFCWEPWAYCVCECGRHIWIPFFDLNFIGIDRCDECLVKKGYADELPYYYGAFRVNGKQKNLENDRWYF